MCCCLEGDSIRRGEARGVIANGIVVHGSGREGIWTSLGAFFLRGCCKGFVTFAGLGVKAWEGRPARLVALYSQSRPLLWQRVQVGFCLVHLTFAAAQALQLSRNLGALGAMDGGLCPVAAAPMRIRVRFPEVLPNPVRSAVLDVVGALGCMRNSGECTAAMAVCNRGLSAANTTQCDFELCGSSKVTRHLPVHKGLHASIYQSVHSGECRKVYLLAHLASHWRHD